MAAVESSPVVSAEAQKFAPWKSSALDHAAQIDPRLPNGKIVGLQVIRCVTDGLATATNSCFFAVTALHHATGLVKRRTENLRGISRKYPRENRPWAHQRIPQPKFFKRYRGFAGQTDKRKTRCTTNTYAWRSKRYSNRRSGYRKLPFEISAEFRLRGREMADREKLPQQVRIGRCTPRPPILRLQQSLALLGPSPCGPMLIKVRRRERRE